MNRRITITSDVDGIRGLDYLKQVSKPILFPDENLEEDIQSLQSFCKQDRDSLALAAVQIGIPKRMIYVKNTNLQLLENRNTKEGREAIKDYDEARVFINPIITLKEGLTVCWEACASCVYYNEKNELIKINGKVKRPYKIMIQYYDKNGHFFEESFEGFPATVLCHEMDHLDGVLHMDVADEVIETTIEEGIQLREKEPYLIFQKTGDYESLKKK